MKKINVLLFLVSSSLFANELSRELISGESERVDQALIEIYEEAGKLVRRSESRDIDEVLSDVRAYTEPYTEEILALDPKSHPRVFSLLNFLPPEPEVFDHILELYNTQQTDLSRISANAVISLNRFNEVTEFIALDSIKNVEDFSTFRAGATLALKWQIKKAIQPLEEAADNSDPRISELAEEVLSALSGEQTDESTELKPENSSNDEPSEIPDKDRDEAITSESKLVEKEVKETSEENPHSAQRIYWVLGALILAGVGVLAWNSRKGSSAG